MIGFVSRFAAMWVALGFCVRLVLIHELSVSYSWSLLWPRLAIGVLNDLLALTLIGAFLGVGLLGGRWIRHAWLALTLGIMAVVLIAEIFFWSEFEGRLDRLVFHYLGYPKEVLVFLEDQFYLSLFLAPFLLIVWLWYRWVRRWLPDDVPWHWPAGFFAAGLLTVVLVPVPTPGHSRFLNDLASNGYLGVLRAAGTDNRGWEDAYWAPRIAKPYVKGSVPMPEAIGAKHLIILVMESYSGQAWWDPELRPRYMPQLQKMSGEGVYLAGVYATGSRTTRGLEAILNGYPPLPGIALNQREGFEQLPSLPRVLGHAGFHSSFIYGGWPDFSGFFTYWRGTGFDEMTSRYDFDELWFETSWGVADEILFQRVVAEMDRLTREHERVFVSTLTVTNHRPFDFPDGRVAYPAHERRAEYAVAYADYALGAFVEEARRHDWFDDTLLVVVADHGPKLIGQALVPIAGYRVPVVLMHPELGARTVEHLGSTMSLPATLLGLLGVDDNQHFYGDNLLDDEQGLAPVEHNFHIGLVEPHGLTVLARGGGVLSWLRDGNTLAPTRENLDAAERVARLFRHAHERFYRSAASQ